MFKAIFTSVGFLLCCLLHAQTDTTKISRLQLGFNLSAQYSNLLHNDALPNNATLNQGPGFRLGTIAEYKIAPHFAVSPKVELSFNESNVILQTASSATWYKVMSTSIDMMMHFMVKSEKGQMRPYFFTGPALKIPLEKQVDNSTNASTQKDLAIDFGIGLEHNAPYFKFSPELRYSYGLFNVNDNLDLPELHLHTVAVVFNFKG